LGVDLHLHLSSALATIPVTNQRKHAIEVQVLADQAAVAGYVEKKYNCHVPI